MVTSLVRPIHACVARGVGDECIRWRKPASRERSGVYVHDLTGDREVLSFGTDQPAQPGLGHEAAHLFAAVDMLGPRKYRRPKSWLDGALSGYRLDGNLC